MKSKNTAGWYQVAFIDENKKRQFIKALHAPSLKDAEQIGRQITKEIGGNNATFLFARKNHRILTAKDV